MPSDKCFFQRIPFIRISSLFLLGIITSHCIPIGIHWITILFSFQILILVFLWHNTHFSKGKFHNLLIILALFHAGIFYHTYIVDEQLPIYQDKEYFIAEVCQKPIEKANTFQAVLRIQSKGESKHEKVIAYFSKVNFDTTLLAGDQLIMIAKPQPISNMNNPFAFDYRAMMRNKGIYSSVYLPPQSYRKSGIQLKRIIYFAEHIRDKLIIRLKTTAIGDEERAVISALTLGFREDLDQETMNYFVNTGTIHVLSVSGLHVALIFFILSFIFSGINKGKLGTVVYPVLMIMCLWSYAFITGFSPSVQRSTVMFSFVIIGSILRRPVNIYNSLTASAIVLILLDPNILFDIGFQLSYLAVFGIVLLQSPLENLLHIKNKILKRAWILFTISISAQLITFPLSIFYFNQFPNLFWISNYCVIPGTTFIIWLTIAFFILSPIALISDLLADLIQFITHQMLVILKWMSEWPNAVTEGIVYNQLQTWLLYGLIASFLIFGFSKNKSWLFMGIVLLISFQACLFYTNCGLFNQKILYVYQTKGSLIHCINGRENYILKNDNIPITEKEIHLIQNVCNHLKLKKPRFIDLRKTTDLNTEDLKISNHTFSFINCRINYTDKLNFHIEGTDLLRFKSDNTALFKKDIIHPTLSASHMNLNKKESFLMDFTLPFKEAMCIFIN